MLSNDILAGIARQAEIEAAKSVFFSQGKRMQILPAAGDGFPPERSEKIDPETILQRKRKKPTLMERAMLRRMADEL